MNVLDAFHQTVHGCEGGCEALAARMGMSPVILRNKANPNSATNKPNLDEVDRIVGLTGDTLVINALAANHGGIFVKIDQNADASDMAVLELITQVWTTNGEVGAEVNKTLADGRVDPHEVVRVRQAIYRAQKAMLEMVARLDAMAE